MQDALEEALRLDARKKIYEIIKSNPGLHFRELQRRSGLATGALQYHLDYLVKKHLVKTERDSKFLRYFLVRERFDDVKLMSLLRQDSIRGIVVFLMGKRSAVFETIVKNSGLSSSTVSWHLEKLVEFQIVQKYVSGKKTFYKIVDKDRVASILVGYKESFLDSVVDNFVEVWEKL
jgi:predicted transcriptional regulator